MKKIFYALAAVVIVVVGILAYVYSTNMSAYPAYTQQSPYPTQTPSQPSGTGTTQNQTTQNQTSATDVFSISEKEYSFSPSTISAKLGDTVVITVTNDGTTIHNLYIEGYNVGTNILAPGQSQTITFVANQKGTFAFKCTVDSHAELGMIGSLVVS